LVFWLVSAAAVVFLVSLIAVAPVAAAGGHNEIAEGIYRGFGIFCHQRADRSYFIEGHKLAVCSRCTGLYAGFAFTLLLYPLVRSLRSAATPPRKVLFLAVLPTVIDFGLTFLGIWENTHTSRLLTGAILGGVTVFFVMPGIADLSLRGLRLSTPAAPSFTLTSPESIAAAPSDYSAPERRI
jgi:uncharacterized membrane protein